MRKEFEAWFQTISPGCLFERFQPKNFFGRIPGEYTTDRLETAWLAYQAGALAMRERAAKVNEEYHYESGGSCKDAAAAIRALPVDS